MGNFHQNRFYAVLCFVNNIFLNQELYYFGAQYLSTAPPHPTAAPDPRAPHQSTTAAPDRRAPHPSTAPPHPTPEHRTAAPDRRAPHPTDRPPTTTAPRPPHPTAERRRAPPTADRTAPPRAPDPRAPHRRTRPPSTAPDRRAPHPTTTAAPDHDRRTRPPHPTAEPSTHRPPSTPHPSTALEHRTAAPDRRAPHRTHPTAEHRTAEHRTRPSTAASPSTHRHLHPQHPTAPHHQNKKIQDSFSILQHKTRNLYAIFQHEQCLASKPPCSRNFLASTCALVRSKSLHTSYQKVIHIAHN